jgi:hypothetical protein
MIKKEYDYTIHFTNGLSANARNVKAESKAEILKKIANDNFYKQEEIVTITIMPSVRYNEVTRMMEEK